jgi:transposase
MFDGNNDAKGGVRAEPLRRRWSAQQKARIVEETLIPGTRLSEVARRWQLCPQQIYGWRRAACRDVQAQPARTTGSAARGFVPIVSDVIPLAPAPAPRPLSAAPVIEIRLAGAVVRVSATDDTARLTAVLRAVRASGLRA